MIKTNSRQISMIWAIFAVERKYNGIETEENLGQQLGTISRTAWIQRLWSTGNICELRRHQNHAE